jgi:hypothetical protein
VARDAVEVSRRLFHRQRDAFVDAPRDAIDGAVRMVFGRVTAAALEVLDQRAPRLLVFFRRRRRVRVQPAEEPVEGGTGQSPLVHGRSFRRGFIKVDARNLRSASPRVCELHHIAQ